MLKRIAYKVGLVFMGILIIPAIITLMMRVKTPIDSQNQQDQSMNQVQIIDAETGNKISLNFEEYIKGVVAAEMPASFEMEALKAQAIAARTYAVKRMEDQEQLSTDYHTGQAYVSLGEQQQRWGDHFHKYYSKISQAVNETQGIIMVYEDEPIEAVFHSTSAGITQDAKDVWTADVPYLKSVDSVEDINAPDFMMEKSIKESDIIRLLRNVVPDIILADQNLMQQMQVIDRNDSGYILEIQVGNKVLTGREIREILDLRSSNFTIEQNGEDLVFTTKGYGHGVGMSQNGANFMAQEGKNYEEILRHYYQGISFTKMKKDE